MSTPKVTVSIRNSPNGTSIIDIAGEINAAAEAPLTEAWNAATSGGAKVLLLNFSGLEYMNSSGIGLLVTMLIRAKRQNQRLAAFGLSDHYRQIFELTRLNEAIVIYPNEAEAVKSVG
jgi:anti-anti-sigma factor